MSSLNGSAATAATVGGENPNRRDWWTASPFAVAAVLLLMPWPSPSVVLRDVCDLTPAGRYAFQCDLEAAAQKSGRGWLRRSIGVYEDGILLRQADRAGAVKQEGATFHTTGFRLMFSAVERGDPRTNGREYLARPARWDPLGLEEGSRRTLAVGILVATFAAICLLRGRAGVALAWAGAILIALAGVAAQVRGVVWRSPVHVDAGYALPAAEAIVAGAVPYDTLLFNYTPLGVYQFALWNLLWPGSAPPPYSWYIAFVLLNELLCALLVFAILRRSERVAWGLSTLAAISFFSMTLWFDGGRVLFEPLYLWPILASAWLATREPRRASRLGAGVLAALALLTKQYGGFGLFGLAVATLTEGRGWRRSLWWIGVGFAAGFVVLVALLLAMGVDLRALVVQAIGVNYPRRYEATWLKLFLWQCPIALLALGTPFLPGAWSRPGVRVAFCFALASCLPFYFRQHQYYFLNPCPWLFILFALGVQVVGANRLRMRPLVSALAAALLLSIPLRAAPAQAFGLSRADQLRRGRLMNEAWPAGRKTLVFMLPSFYHVTHYRSGDEANMGYRFAHECTAEQLRQGFARADGAWIDPRGMYARGADRVLKEAGTSLAEELLRNGFEQKQVLEGRFELWTKGS